MAIYSTTTFALDQRPINPVNLLLLRKKATNECNQKKVKSHKLHFPCELAAGVSSHRTPVMSLATYEMVICTCHPITQSTGAILTKGSDLLMALFIALVYNIVKIKMTLYSMQYNKI